MLAAEIFAQADGLEYDPGYVAAAKAALCTAAVAAGAVCLQADALNFDGYGDYDVIYFYQPMQRRSDLMRLERRIVDRCPPGTILIAPYQHFRTGARGIWAAATLPAAVYVAGHRTGRKADALRDAAEADGTQSGDPRRYVAQSICRERLSDSA